MRLPGEKFDGENWASAFQSGIIYMKTVKIQKRKLWTPAAPNMLRIIPAEWEMDEP